MLNPRWLQYTAILILTAALSHTAAFASQCKKPKVFFINGVLNNVNEANEASSYLEDVISANGGPARLGITTIYNPTDPGLGDAIEVGNDSILSRSFLNFTWFASIAADQIVGNVPKLLLALFNLPGGSGFNPWFVKQIEGSEAALRNEAVIEKIQNKLFLEIKNNNPVVVIAHSQGNFYLNQALQRLKSKPLSESLPGIQAIGVLGIGVASKINPAKLPSGSDLYRYVTRDDDRIIGLLSAELTPNFITKSPSVAGTALNHLLKDDYLTDLVFGAYDGEQNVSIRRAVAQAFNKIYAATAREYPCLDAAVATPNPVPLNARTTFSVKVSSRLGTPINAGTVIFKDGKTVICATTQFAADGTAACDSTLFAAEAAGKTINAQWYRGVFDSADEPLSLTVGPTYWAATFKADECPLYDQTPSGAGNQTAEVYVWFWEKPCYTMSTVRAVYGSLAQNSFSSFYGRFLFENSGNEMIFESDGNRMRHVVNWNSTKDIATLEIPTSFSMARPLSRTMLNYDGIRKIELKIITRSATRLSGTFSVKSLSAYGFFNPYVGDYSRASEDSVKILQTETTGIWTADMVRAAIPDLQLNGNDACFRDNFGTRGKRFQTLYRGPFKDEWGIYNIVPIYFADNLILVDSDKNCSYGAN